MSKGKQKGFIIFYKVCLIFYCFYRVAIITFARTQYALNIPRLKGMFNLRVKTLETMDIIVVDVDYELWDGLADREKLAYIEREVKYKLTLGK